MHAVTKIKADGEAKYSYLPDGEGCATSRSLG